MKFTRDQYNLKPPSVHGWMRKYYCPVLEELLSFERLQPLVEKSWKRDNYTVQLIDHNYSVLLETRNACSRGARKAFDKWNGRQENGIRIKVYFKDSTSFASPNYSVIFNIEEAYLVAYMFKIVKHRTGPAQEYDVLLIEEHCTKVERIGLVEPGLKERARIKN